MTESISPKRLYQLVTYESCAFENNNNKILCKKSSPCLLVDIMEYCVLELYQKMYVFQISLFQLIHSLTILLHGKISEMLSFLFKELLE